MSNPKWGIDLGGTKIEGIILDEAGIAHPRCRLRVPTEAAEGYDHIIAQIERLVSQMEVESGLKRPARLGIGTPGTIDPPTGLMKNCNTTAFNGRPLPEDLSRHLGIEVCMANDANCFALAEATLGAAKGESVVFGVILGTGVGGGIVVDGKVLGGAQGIAGEWGHNLLEPEGTPCYCGKVGCVETVLAGPSLARYYNSLTGHELKLPQIMDQVGHDSAADATKARLINQFGLALSVVINILDPDAIVLGGGVGNIECLYTEGLAALRSHVFNPRVETKLLRPTLGDSAGVFGAAMLTS